MALETYNMTMPRTIYSGKDALKNLQTVVAGAKKVAVFTDKGILSTGLVELPLAQLKEAGVETLVISDLPPEPTYGPVQQLVDEFKASGAKVSLKGLALLLVKHSMAWAMASTPVAAAIFRGRFRTMTASRIT